MIYKHSINHIQGIGVIKKDQIYQIQITKSVPNLVNQHAFYQEENIVGYLQDGHLVASFFACILSRNVAFIRQDSKKYGTCNQLDGMHDSQKPSVVFCNKAQLNYLLKTIGDFEIPNVTVYTFDTVLSDDLEIKRNTPYPLSLPNKTHDNITKNVELLRNREFYLSSGKVTTQYYETLKAANTYETSLSALSIFENILDFFDMCLGISYGGTYFATLNALARGQVPVIIDSSKLKHNTELSDLCVPKNVAVLDDFVSTGINYRLIKNSLKLQNSSLICMYGYDTSDGEIKIAHHFPRLASLL